MVFKKVYDMLKASGKDIRKSMSEIEGYQILSESDIYSDKYKEKIRDKIRESEQEIRNKKIDTRRKIAEIISDEIAKYEDMDSPKTKDLSEDVQLLQTGIKLNTTEVTRLLQKAENQNPTMRRLIIQAYKESNGLDDTQVMKNLPLDDRIYVGHQNEIAEVKSLQGVADIYLDRWAGTDRADYFLDKVFRESIVDDAEQ